MLYNVKIYATHNGDPHQVPVYLAAPAAAQGAVSAEDQWIEQTRHLNCPVCNGSGHIEDVLPQGDAAQRALLELLLLKDMKDKWEAEELSGFAYKSTDNHRLHNEQRANYMRRKPLAWEAARKALAAPPPAGAQQAVADETPRQAVEAIMAECKFQLTGYGRDIAELAYLRGRAIADQPTKNEALSLPKPVLCVSSKAFKRMRAGDDHVKAWLPPLTNAEDMALFSEDQMRGALAAPAAAQGADCARCKGVGAVGDHNGERAVEISCDHCGGTGRAPSATPAPEAAPAEENKPVISIEDSLRTRLRWSEEKVEQLEHENRELRGRIPGPSFDDLMDGARASKKDTTTTDPEVSKVFIVATGETHDGQETYTRHNVCPPLCDAEVLYSMPSRIDEKKGRGSS